MQPQIFHTEYPSEPPQGFNEWQEYIHTIQEERSELQRFKREIELSFDKIHKSMTQGIPKNQ